MASLNKTQLIGHLGRDIELRYLPNGDAVAALNVATTESWKDKASGEKREATEWHRCVIFGRLAEVAGQYLKKGSLVYLEGKNTTRKYNDKDGAEKYVHEIKVDTMQMLDRAPAGNQGGTQSTNQGGGATGGSRQRNQPAPAASHNSGGSSYPAMDDEIPFAEMGAGQAWSTI